MIHFGSSKLEKNSMNVKKKGSAVLFALILSILCWVLAGVLRPLYTSVDNFTISTVTNGLYGNEYYCIYLHPILCVIIHFISSIIPSADAFLLLAHLLVLFETAWLLYLSFVSWKSRLQKTAFIMLTLFSVVVLSLYNTNYTVQGASFVFTGWLTLFLANDKEQHKRTHNIIGIVFIILGTMWRVKAALLFIPFLILEFIISLIENRKIGVTGKNIARYGFCVAIVLFLLISQILVNNSSKYSDAVRYDQARITLEDFPTQSWDQVEDELRGIDEFEFESVKSWFLADTEHLTPDTLEEMATAATTTKYTWSFKGVLAAVSEMISFIAGNSKIVWVVVLLLFLIFVQVVTGHLSCLRKIESLFALLGGLLIILYFTVLGRAPLRVWYPVFYAILLILILQIDREPVERDKTNKRLTILCSLIVLLSFSGIAYSILQNGFDSPDTALVVREEKSDLRYEETYSGDSLYFWGAWHSLVTQYYMSEEKLPTEEFLNHNSCTGDWVYGQNYFIENLSDADAVNPIKALVERDNTYFVSDTCNYALLYMHKYYGENIEAVQVGEILETPIWVFIK